MGVSKNRGTPKSSIFNRVFHYKPSILGYHYFWKHPHDTSMYKDGESNQKRCFDIFDEYRGAPKFNDLWNLKMMV